MPFSPYKTARLRFIFVVYWIFLLYIIAALVWWFIALSQQNRQMTEFELSQLKADDPQFLQQQTEIMSMQRRKTYAIRRGRQHFSFVNSIWCLCSFIGRSGANSG
jgi:hypothetical protein